MKKNNCFFVVVFWSKKIIVDPPFLTPKAAIVHSCRTVSNERTNIKRVRFFIFDGLTMLIFRGAEGVHRLSNKTTSTTQFLSISSCPEKETLWREREKESIFTATDVNITKHQQSGAI